MDKILVIDDEQNIIESISMVLSAAGYETEGCLDGAAAIQKVSNKAYDLILLDIKMPKMDGIEVLEKIMEINPDNVVIMISGHGTIDTAVEATKKGAYNFLQKPLPDLHELKLTIKNAIDYKKSRDELKKVRTNFLQSIQLIGESDKINNVRELIKKIARTNSNVLITGESGTGKELAALQIHAESDRANRNFIEINSANLSEENTDRELFGYIENNNFVQGKFEQADGGTVFLDEISNLTEEIQSKLLSVIETNMITRVGSNLEIRLDVRFIFATNKDLQEELKLKKIREDFYHRINVLQINIPPLRERAEDIPELCDYFIKKFCRENNIPIKKLSEKAKGLLLTLRWPGNVRELKNLMERLIITVDSRVIDADDIDIPGSKHSKEFTELLNKNMSLNDFQNETEKIFILKMLNDYKFNISQTAEALQIQRSHLYNLMSKYEISKPVKKS